MTATLPRPSRPSYGPPTAALPALPVPKTRKSLGGLQTPGAERLEAPNLPRSGLRTPSTSNLRLPSNSGSTPSLPRLQPSPGINATGKTIRKTISINAFPQPPRGNVRTSSVPPSPLSAVATSGGSSSRRESTETSPTTLAASKFKKRSKVSTGGSIPSLLGNIGDSRSISGGAGARGSDGLLSLPSPPQSRSSSAQDSYPQSVSTTEENGEAFRGRESLHGPLDRPSSKAGESKGNVIVSVRARPDAGSHGDASRTDGDWLVDGKQALVAYRGKEGGDYIYDNVFAQNDNNARVYDSAAKRLVRRVMEGYHGTVFAYGMTGTGKTFSMQGTATNPGVIPLAITDIFSYIRETPSREFLLRVSYLEIYNEKIHDLLSASTAAPIGPGAAQPEEIKLREDSRRGVFAVGLKEEIVQSPTQLLRVIARGDQARRTSSTQFNSRSSRSHAVVQIVVESRQRVSGAVAMHENKRSGLPPGGVRVSTLSLIDLAGSERAAENKERRTEGSHINKSLLTLGTVIARLSGDKDKDGKPTDKDGKHLPYRDSKLTRLLQGALSGDSLVSILCTISVGNGSSGAGPNSHAGETLNTLKFASRAKNNIVSHAKKSEEALGAGGEGGARVLLEKYRMEMEKYRQEIAELKSEKAGVNAKAKDLEEEKEREREREADARHEEQILEMALARTALKEKIESLNKLILSSKSAGVNASSSHSRLSTVTSNGHTSSMSMRSSLHGPALQRTTSSRSVSTVGRKISAQHTSEHTSMDDDDSIHEYGNGVASLAAQNRALQADLADKTRYCQTLEKRLLQARRSSQSRTSAGLGSKSGIMVGEDHGVSNLLKEKDAEIAELKSRLDDKDRMLTALRSAARSRDNADRDPRSHTVDNGQLSPVSARASQLFDQHHDEAEDIGAPIMVFPPSLKGSKGVDEMSRMLDEMIQDRVSSGELVKGVRGSVRLASGESLEGPNVSNFGKPQPHDSGVVMPE